MKKEFEIFKLMIENKIKSVEEEIKFRQSVDDNTGYTTGVLFALEVHRDDLEEILELFEDNEYALFNILEKVEK